MSVDFMVYVYDESQRRYWIRHDLPVVNLGGCTAGAVIAALGLKSDPGPSGIVEPDGLPVLLRKIIALTNGPAERLRALEMGESVEVGARGARVIDFGVPAERIASAIARILPVVKAASDHKLHFGWG